MQILVTGGTGPLGRALQAAMRLGSYTWAAPSHSLMDVTQPGAIARMLDASRWDWVINCAAQHDSRGAEVDSRADFLTNAAGPHLLGLACRERGIRLLHLSTNYVFSGEGDPFFEDDPTAPTGVYGIAKRAGEDALTAVNPDAVIVRTSVLFGPERRDGFPGKYVLPALEADRPLRVVCDLWNLPTYTPDLAEGLLALLAKEPAGGIYHLSGRGDPVSWYEYAREVARLSNLPATRLVPIRAHELEGDAPRPAHAILANTKAAALGVELRLWRDALREFLPC